MLIHADNFSIYGTNAALLLNGLYAQVDSVTLVTDPDTVSAGRVAKITNGSGSSLQGLRFASQAGSVATMGVAVRLWMDALPVFSSRPVYPIRVSDNLNNLIATVCVLPNGQLQLQDSAGTQIAITNVPVVTANGWYHIEAKFTQAGAAASICEVRVEGATVINGTGLSFATATNPAQIRIENKSDGAGFGTPFYVKDLVVWDGSGSLNNTFLGSVLVANLAPSADISLNWTPSAGTTGWTILDDIPPIDTNYISAASPPPAAYVATLTDLPTSVTTVKGLITFVRAGKIDGGDGNLQTSIISDPTGTPATANGTDRPITVAQTYWRDVFETDPKTSAAWLVSAVNAARLKINRTV